MEFPFTKTNRISVFAKLTGIDWSIISTFLDGWKDGQPGKLSITKISEPKSLAQLGYYYKIILPEAVKAFEQNEDYSLVMQLGDKQIEVELTLKNMDNFLKLRYAAMSGVYMDKAEMDMAECSAFEDWVIKWLATWFGCQVPPADSNWRQNESQTEKS